MKKTILIEVCASLLILLFLYAALSKWLDIAAFVKAMHNQPFPSWLATFFVWTVPPVEILTSLLLMFKRTQTAGFIVSLVLMSLFTLYIGSILLHFFPRVPCSCGGIIKKLTWSQHLIFNLFFVLISALGTYLATKNKTEFNEPELYRATA